jgi:hypothetical protein
MKTRFFVLLAVVIVMFFGGIATAHATTPTASDDNRPVLCIGNDNHQVYTGDETTEISGNSLYSCLDMARKNPNVVAICNLDDTSFSKCLSNNADVLVKHDPKLPKAWNVFRLYVNDGDKQTYVDILTPKNGAIAGKFNGVPFNLTVITNSDGSSQVNYTIDSVQGGYKFDQYDWVQTGDKAILQRL